MGSYSTTRNSSAYPPPALPQGMIIILGGLVLFVLSLAGLAIGYSSRYAGQIYPGISVAGIDLSGMELNQAVSLLNERIPYPQSGKIVFKDGDHVWAANPSELGLFLDPENSALAAYSFGREGNLVARLLGQFKAWYSGKDLPPLLVYDERIARQYLTNIAAQVDLPTIEASLSIDGVDVVVNPGQVGRTMDIAATLAPLEEQLSTLTDGVLPVVMEENPPVILDVSEQAEIARRILSDSLVLQAADATAGDPGPWTLEPARLARLLVIERVESPDGARYQVGLDTAGLRTFVEAIAPSVSRSPSNARFIFNDETRQLEIIEPATIGRSLMVKTTIEEIEEKLVQGEHNVTLSIDYQQPEVGDDTIAADLGITEQVSAQTTYFYGSSASRIQNIDIAASRFHGVLIPPGGTLSMAEVLGDVSLDNGYAEALIIYGNRTIKGVGGGVCQVSTTLFRTVFFGGYPVAERHPHAYRVYYYELTAAGSADARMAGLDAAVFVPMVDFKFTNDSPYWLLMETYTNAAARTLTWKFYSTSDGRSVTWESSGLQNIVEADDPVYTENPALATGQIEQVDWEVAGADVTVNRTVLKDGQVYFQDRFVTHYLPWRAIYEYGPGTPIPGGGDKDE